MDQEVLDALKKNTIQDQLDNLNSTKKDSKNKTKKSKKANNKKADFLDFAQEKGIEFKLQYEDKEDQRKNYYQKDGKNFQGKFNKNFDGQNDDQKNKNFQGKNLKYQNNKKFGFQNKPKNNKFDQANMMYNQMNFGNGMKSNMNPQGFNSFGQQMGTPNAPQDFNQDHFFSAERTCEEILTYIFSQDFLNKELYLRKRITEEGLIEINNLMIFNR